MKCNGIKSYDIPFIMAAVKYINDHPYSHLTIPTLASEIGINEFKLKIGFRQVVKKTIHQYITEKRLSKAITLLQKTDYTIEEIAYKVGFESRDGFSNAFRKEYKQSPRQFRDSFKVDPGNPSTLPLHLPVAVHNFQQTG